MTVPVPVTVPLSQGTVAIQVVNPVSIASNAVTTFLIGDATQGIPTISSIDGLGVAADSINPGIHQDYVATLIHQGDLVTIGGVGFDSVNGVVVDMFCYGCPRGKVGMAAVPTRTKVMFTVPLPNPSMGIPTITGNVSFTVTNAGAGHLFKFKSNAVAVPILALPAVTSVTQAGNTIRVTGNGFVASSILNFFNDQGCAGTLNLGGVNAAGQSNIPLTITSLTTMSFTVPSNAQKGSAYVQVVNPPFVPFTSSGSGPGGSIILH
jgi:hypothetical protein